MTKEASDMVELVIKKAAKLRELGVRTLDVPGLSLELGDLPPPPPTTATAAEEDEDEGDPLADPRTFGLSKKSKIPNRGDKR